MRIGVLSRNAALYSTGRLVESGRARGHETFVLDTLQVPVQVGRPPAAGSGQLLPELDAIIPRIGTSITSLGLAVVRQLENQGVLTTATSQAIAQSRDKLHSLQVMSAWGLPTPKTSVVTRGEEIDAALESAGGLPVVVKLIRGTQGQGVFLIRDRRTIVALLNNLQAMREQLLIQEYIREAGGRDLRVIVVGRRCLAAMERTAAQGDFRSNLHRGGTARAVVLDAETQALAWQACQAHGLGAAGVDLLRSRRGPLLLEVNSSPGLEGIERVTGVDVAGGMIAYLEEQLARRRPKGVRRRPRLSFQSRAG
ncbi:MAG: ATP-grasp domain-containing protein [Candidatus Promineifilaceae bacterium]